MLSSFAPWTRLTAIVGKSQRKPKSRPTWRPCFESLEGRDVPAPLALPLNNAPQAVIASNAPAQAAPVQTLNQRMLDWIGQHTYDRVGGGECTHLVIEALRANGGRFMDTTNWGTLQVTLKYVKPKNAKPGAKASVVSVNGEKFDPKHPKITGVKPGDVVQYWLKGNPNPVHVGVVHTVDANGWPEMLYEQNVQGERTVQDTKRDLKLYEHGATVKIFRPVTRAKPPAGKTEFTIVNKTPYPVNYAIRETPPNKPALADVLVGPLGADNTMPSYNSAYNKAGNPKSDVELVVTAIINGAPTTQTTPLEDGAGYEVVEDVSGIILRNVDAPPPQPQPLPRPIPVPQPIPQPLPPIPMPLPIPPAPEKDREQLSILWDVLSLTKNASQAVWLSLQFGQGDDAVALRYQPDAGTGGAWGDVWGDLLAARDLIVTARILFDAAREATSPEQGRLVDQGNAKLAEAKPMIRHSEQVWAELWSATFVRA